MLDLIENRLPHLSEAESAVARWVLRHLGLSGFRDLTLRLTESLSQPSTYAHRDVKREDSAQDAAAKVMDSAVQTLINQRLMLRNVKIDRAAALLAGARQIVFAGVGGSGLVAEDAQHKFFRLGIPCVAVSNAPNFLQIAAIADPDDVFVVTSNSGRWPTLLTACASAQRRGAAVIALTAPDSKLGKTADLLIPCSAQDETSVYTPMNSRLAQLAILDVLQVATALAVGDSAYERLRLSKRALGADPAAEKRYLG